MKINLKTAPKGQAREIEIEKNTSLEEIYRKYENELDYTVLAARVNNEIKELTYRLDSDCNVELLDMRTQAANLIYQHSLSLIYLKAVNDCLGDVKVEIQNALNKGLYTEVKTGTALTEEQVRNIEMRMQEIVDADIPYVVEHVPNTESDSPKTLKYYSIDGFRDFFYGLMVPSTGYVKRFELMKYRRGVLLRFPHPSNPNVIPEYEDEVKLYQAFGEQTRWDKLLGVNYVADLNRKIRNGECRDLIQLSEALHEKKIGEIADEIKDGKKRIVLIAGPSSSGKTTFAQRLCIQLRVNGLNPLYMGTDDYFVEREDTPLDEHGEKDYECLEAVDIKLFNNQLNALLAGETVDLPTFDFIKGTKVFGKRLTSVKPGQPIVIEGIHGLNELLTPDIPKEEKYKIYISPLTQLNIDPHNRISTTDERMLRRMVRDNLYRGHSAQETIADWPKVRKGEDKYIFPYNGEADVLFNSYHVYEISVLKKYAEPLLKNITKEEAEYADAARMLKFLSFFDVIEDDSVIVNNSILREFIGGSVFVD
ncbi:MAG: nucleoside kinase [Eubacteriaceae bacterium]|nr:nucleoside kinase [Eubacteriaceae bacterium]